MGVPVAPATTLCRSRTAEGGCHHRPRWQRHGVDHPRQGEEHRAVRVTPNRHAAHAEGIIAGEGEMRAS